MEESVFSSILHCRVHLPDAVRQPAQENLADLIWHYYQGEQTEPFSKMLLLSLQAEKFELAIELLKLHKLDQIFGAIDQIAVKRNPSFGQRNLKKQSRPSGGVRPTSAALSSCGAGRLPSLPAVVRVDVP